MKTLDEAIKHCEEKAKELSNKAYAEWGMSMSEEEAYKCHECAFEHDQLAKWLKELKALKDSSQGEWIDEGIYAEGHNEHAYTCSKCGFQIIENKNSLLENRFCKNCGTNMRKGSTESLDYQRAVEDAEYCERYEPTYNPNDGSM